MFTEVDEEAASTPNRFRVIPSGPQEENYNNRETNEDDGRARKISQGRKFSLAGIFGGRRRSSVTLPQPEDFPQNNSTIGLYGKSLHRYTNEALPKLENYRDVRPVHRPTIDDLHLEVGGRKVRFFNRGFFFKIDYKLYNTMMIMKGLDFWRSCF
jgi:hypothetical protein